MSEESRKRRRSDELLDVASSVSPVPVNKKEKTASPTGWKSEHERLYDPAQLYGLKPEYLKKLGIIPPLSEWIHVTNFRCDKSDLRDVLELAGHVVTCSVITIREKYAKVKYSHPLEAVQAISMFHNQKFYGHLLKIFMASCPPDTIILPKGLHDVGPGLGIGGKPVRDIINEYEKFTEKKESLLNKSLFSKVGKNDADDDNVSLKTVDSWEGEWFVKDEIKDDKSDDSIELKVDNFSKTRRFTIRNVEDDSDGNESDSAHEDKGTQSPPLEAPGVSSLINAQKNVDRCDSQNMPKRASSIGSNSSRGSSASASQRNLKQIMPQTAPYRCPEPRIRPLLPNPPGVNSSPGFSPMGPRPIAPISGSNNPMIRPNAPNFMPSSLVSNSVCPVPRLGGPIQGSNAMPVPSYVPRPVPAPVPIPHNNVIVGSGGPVPGSNIPILGSRPDINGPRPGLPMPGPGSIGPVAPNRLGPNPILPVPNSMVGPRPNLGGVMSNGPMVGPHASMTPTSTATLEFRNLPPSTTFPILCGKMSECGQVLSVQMTTPGCAIVKFVNPSHAERCFQRYNRTCVEGCLIEARFV